jgi:RNA polymerase sigma-70 factor (ECF subfamily)
MVVRSKTQTDVIWSEHVVEIARIRDRSRFAELFGYFAPRLKSYFMRLGQGSDVAEELAQETMLAVWRKASTFDPARASAATWIFTIARNLRVDRLRRERDPAQLSEYYYEREPAATPSDDFISTERANRVRDALAALSRDQLDVIRLSFFEDRSHAEISKELNIPLGTVKSRVRLAVERLRVLVEELR